VEKKWEGLVEEQESLVESQSCGRRKRSGVDAEKKRSKQDGCPLIDNRRGRRGVDAALTCLVNTCPSFALFHWLMAAQHLSGHSHVRKRKETKQCCSTTFSSPTTLEKNIKGRRSRAASVK